MTIKLRNYSILLFFTIVIISCENSETIIPKTGEPFGRAQMMKFYFSNSAGEDLLNLQSNKIRPITYDFSMQIPEQETFEDSVNFFYDSGSVSFNSDIGRYYWNTVIYGKKGYLKHQFYVYISENDIDTIKAEFRYTTGATGGDGIYANIEKLTYNDVVIRSKENTLSEFIPEHIYITKENGKSTISFEEK